MSFSLNKVYNFSTLAPAVLGGEHKNMKVKALVLSEEALKHRDIITLHDNIKQTLSGLPTYVKDCSYVIFTNVLTGEELVLANEYIDINSIVEVQSVNIQARVLNVTTDDMPIIREALLSLGYNNLELTTY
jgi:hypothetical protein